MVGSVSTRREEHLEPENLYTGKARNDSLRILVVDDDSDTTSATSALLMHKGHQVESATSGRRALDKVGEFLPEIILLDLVMPDVNGMEVARTIRQMPLSTKPIIAAQSGATTSRARRQCAEAGFDHFFLKPVAISDIDQVVALARLTRPEYEGLADRFDAVAFRFTRSQLAFCNLILDSFPLIRDVQYRNLQAGRIERILAYARTWFHKQKRMPIGDMISMRWEIDKLECRLLDCRK